MSSKAFIQPFVAPISKRKPKGSNSRETKLLEAAAKGKVEYLAKFIKKGGDINCKDVTEGDTALHIAAESGQVRFMAELLKANPDVNALTPNRETPLHRATFYSNVDIVLLLLKSGADMLAGDKLEQTPVGISIVNGLDDVFLAMIDHLYDINVMSSKGNTLLHEASIHDNRKCILALLKKGADINLQNKTGNTALHLAALNGSTGAIAALMAFHPNISIKNFSGNTPSDCAFQGGNADLAKLLTEKSKDPEYSGSFIQPSRDGTKQEAVTIFNASVNPGSTLKIPKNDSPKSTAVNPMLPPPSMIVPSQKDSSSLLSNLPPPPPDDPVVVPNNFPPPPNIQNKNVQTSNFPPPPNVQINNFPPIQRTGSAIFTPPPPPPDDLVVLPNNFPPPPNVQNKNVQINNFPPPPNVQIKNIPPPPSEDTIGTLPSKMNTNFPPPIPRDSSTLPLPLNNLSDSSNNFPPPLNVQIKNIPPPPSEDTIGTLPPKTNTNFPPPPIPRDSPTLPNSPPPPPPPDGFQGIHKAKESNIPVPLPKESLLPAPELNNSNLPPVLPPNPHSVTLNVSPRVEANAPPKANVSNFSNPPTRGFITQSKSTTHLPSPPPDEDMATAKANVVSSFDIMSFNFNPAQKSSLKSAKSIDESRPLSPPVKRIPSEILDESPSSFLKTQLNPSTTGNPSPNSSFVPGTTKTETLRPVENLPPPKSMEKIPPKSTENLPQPISTNKLPPPVSLKNSNLPQKIDELPPPIPIDTVPPPGQTKFPLPWSASQSNLSVKSTEKISPNSSNKEPIKTANPISQEKQQKQQLPKEELRAQLPPQAVQPLPQVVQPPAQQIVETSKSAPAKEDLKPTDPIDKLCLKICHDLGYTDEDAAEDAKFFHGKRIRTIDQLQKLSKDKIQAFGLPPLVEQEVFKFLKL